MVSHPDGQLVGPSEIRGLAHVFCKRRELFAIEPALARSLRPAGVRDVEAVGRVHLDPLALYSEVEHAEHVPQSVVGYRGCAGRNDSGQYGIDVNGANLVDRKFADGWVDVPLQHTSDHIGILVLPGDVSNQIFPKPATSYTSKVLSFS